MSQWIADALMLVSALGIAAWVAGAIYFDAGRGARWAWVPTVGWCLAVVGLFAAWRPLWQPYLVLVGVGLGLVAWWLSLRPRHDREWDATVAVLPRAVRQGDVVTIENVRDNEYRSCEDFTPRYHTRSYDLANLKAADVLFFYWGSPWMSHPALVFDFGPDGRVCMSIEVRFRKGQRYSVLRSLYRQQELIFLAVEERDAILFRTRHHGLEGYLYRLNESADRLRTAFLDYVDAINDLYERPRWYHALCANCTTSFYRLPNSQRRCDWRVIANGRLDRALYEAGQLDRSLPFEELRRSAYINEIANEAPAEGFGDHLRGELERRRRGR